MATASVSLTSATLSWPAASDASAEGPHGKPLRYRLFRDGKVLLDTTGLSTAVTGLVLGEGHVFKIEATRFSSAISITYVIGRSFVR